MRNGVGNFVLQLIRNFIVGVSSLFGDLPVVADLVWIFTTSCHKCAFAFSILHTLVRTRIQILSQLQILFFEFMDLNLRISQLLLECHVLLF